MIYANVNFPCSTTKTYMDFFYILAIHVYMILFNHFASYCFPSNHLPKYKIEVRLPCNLLEANEVFLVGSRHPLDARFRVVFVNSRQNLLARRRICITAKYFIFCSNLVINLLNKYHLRLVNIVLCCFLLNHLS